MGEPTTDGWTPLHAVPRDPEMAALAYIAQETNAMPFEFHGLVFSLIERDFVTLRPGVGVLDNTIEVMVVTAAGRAALAAYRAQKGDGADA